MCSQLTPLAASPLKTAPFLRAAGRPEPFVYHCKNTLKKAIARNPRSPLLKLGVWFLEKHKRNFPRLWGSTLSSEPLLEPVRHLVHCLCRETLQHLPHQAVCGSVSLVLLHVPSRAQNSVDCDLYMLDLEGSQAVTTTSLVPNPLGLDF